MICIGGFRNWRPWRPAFHIRRDTVQLPLLVAFLVTGGCGIDVTTVPSERELNVGDSAPTGLTVSTADPFGVVLSWKDRSSVETAFWVERRAHSADVRGNPLAYERIGIAVPNSTLYQDQEVVTDTTFSYRVRAVQGQASLGTSNEVSTWIPTYRFEQVSEYALPTSPTVLSMISSGFVADQADSGIWVYGFQGSALQKLAVFTLDDLDSYQSMTFDGNYLYTVGKTMVESKQYWQIVFRYRSGSFNWSKGVVVREYTVNNTPSLAIAADNNTLYVLTNKKICQYSFAKYPYKLVRCETGPVVGPVTDVLAATARSEIILISTVSGNIALSMPADSAKKVTLLGQASGPHFVSFWDQGDTVWGRDSDGFFYRFDDLKALYTAQGSAVDSGWDDIQDDYRFISEDGGRYVVSGCKSGIKVMTAGTHVLGSYAPGGCIQNAILSGSILTVLMDGNQIRRIRLLPRFGTSLEP